ncbi:hypothetical protein PFISCL1PPCAC_19942, partial [Pristionchus fissidentatus]
LLQMASVAEQLVEMGFDAADAENAAKHNDTLERAMDWLVSRQESEGVNNGETGATCTTMEIAPCSYKCNDCGKLMKDENAMMFHASKTGHENFAESTDTIKPLTPEERIEQAARLKERIKESLSKKAVMEEQEKYERERKRVQEGKLMLERNEKRKENEQLAAIAQRKKDKEEDENAKRRVLEQIKADKEARKGVCAGVPPSQPVPLSLPIQHKKEYKEANIQIRLPSGETIRNTFGVSEELSAVRLWIEVTRPELVPFALLQPFPRKVLSSEDMAAPLSSHGLVPSGSLVVTRSQ